MLLIIMGALPLVLVIFVGASNMITELEDIAVKNGALRNIIISEHVTELMEKNFYVLRTPALNSMTVDCVSSPTDDRKAILSDVLRNANAVFDDANLMVLTASDAGQLIRTDNSELVISRN